MYRLSYAWSSAVYLISTLIYYICDVDTSRSKGEELNILALHMHELIICWETESECINYYELSQCMIIVTVLHVVTVKNNIATHHEYYNYNH